MYASPALGQGQVASKNSGWHQRDAQRGLGVTAEPGAHISGGQRAHGILTSLTLPS